MSKIKITLIIVFVTLVYVLVIPYIINELFKKNEGYITLWSASDALVYTSSVFGFLGTLLFIILTFKQNNISSNQAKDANNISNQLIEIEKERIENEFKPFVLVSKWEKEQTTQISINNSSNRLYVQILESDENKPQLCLNLTLVNTRKSFVLVEYFEGFLYNHDESDENNHLCKLKNCLSNTNTQKLSIKNGASAIIRLYGDKDKILNCNNKKIKLIFILENEFGERYKESLYLCGIYINNSNIFMSPQDYQIEKC